MVRSPAIRSLLVPVLALSILAAAAGAAARAGDRSGTQITLGVVSTNADWAPMPIAYQLGFFAKEGVDATLEDNLGANAANLVASGQVDIAATPAPTALLVGQQGKPATTIWNNENYPGIALVSDKDISSIAALRSASNCRIAMSPPGSALIYAGNIYKRELGLKNCTLVVVATPTIQAQGVISGAYQGATVAYSQALTIADAGGHILLDPTTASYRATYGRAAFPSGVMWGLSSDLRGKKSAVVGVLRGLMGANNYINTHGNAQVTAILQQRDIYKTIPASAIAGGIAAVRPYLGDFAASKTSTPGAISSADWAKSLSAFANYGLTSFDASASSNSYSNAIDMSYYKAAFPHIVVVDSTHNTLVKLAAWKLGSASDWKTLYTSSKFWFDTLNVPASKIPTVRLAVGTVFWW